MKVSRNPLALAVGASILLPYGARAADADSAALATFATAMESNSLSIARDQLRGTGPSEADDTLPELNFAPLQFKSPASGGKDTHDSTVQKAEIKAGNDGGTATFKLVNTSGNSHVTQPFRGSNRFEWRGQLNTFSLVVSAPFDKKGTESAIVTNSGVPSDFNAKIGYSILHWSGSFNFDDMVSLRPELIAACERTHASDAVPQAVACKDMNEEDLGSFIQPDIDAWLLGGEASAGYQKFDFFDMATAAKANTSKTPWSASAYVGWIWGDDAPLLLARVEYKDIFKAGSTGTLCPVPSPAPPVLACVTGAIGAPKETQSFVASFEIRRELTFNGSLHSVGIDNLGIDAKFSYDTQTDIYGFDLPLSFAVDDKGNLVGGVDFGWQSDHHQFIAGLFLNSTFSLLPSG